MTVLRSRREEDAHDHDSALGNWMVNAKKVEPEFTGNRRVADPFTQASLKIFRMARLSRFQEKREPSVFLSSHFRISLRPVNSLLDPACKHSSPRFWCI